MPSMEERHRVAESPAFDGLSVADPERTECAELDPPPLRGHAVEVPEVGARHRHVVGDDVALGDAPLNGAVGQ